MARLDRRAAQDRGPPDRSYGAWREREGRLPPGDTGAAGLRIFRQADHPGVGSGPHSACVGRPHEAPGVHPLRGARGRLGRAGDRPHGPRRSAGIGRDPLQHALRGSPGHPQPSLNGSSRAGRPLGGGAVRVRAVELLLHQGAGLRSRDGQPPADALRDRGFTGRPSGLDARPRRAQLRADGAGLRRQPRRAHPRRAVGADRLPPTCYFDATCPERPPAGSVPLRSQRSRYVISAPSSRPAHRKPT